MNFRAAAEELYISQPSLSRSIDTLEHELGVVLFERTGRHIALTGSGRLFLEYTNRILDECDRAIYKMKELSTNGGRIDIGYVFPLANYYIPHKVRSFLDIPENEKVTFGFTQNRSSSIIREIKNGNLDVGFCSFSENEEELEFTPILKQEMVIITSKDHPLAEKDDLSIRELTHYPVIGYDRISGLGGVHQSAVPKPEYHSEYHLRVLRRKRHSGVGTGTVRHRPRGTGGRSKRRTSENSPHFRRRSGPLREHRVAEEPLPDSGCQALYRLYDQRLGPGFFRTENNSVTY